MNCEKNGVTKFMLHKIPFFKECMISAFQCEECGFKNSEVTFAGKLEDTAVRYELNCINNIAFNRTVVKSEYATIKVPEAGLEIPAQTQKGSIKTIEGFFLATIEGLSDMQEERREFDPVTAGKIDEYIKKLETFRSGDAMPFTFILEDPSGNSYIENPAAPTVDQYCKKIEWLRTAEEYVSMGYPADAATLAAEEDKAVEDKTQKANLAGFGKESRKAIRQTKEEQEALLAKAAAYAKREPVTSAAGVNFGYSVEDQEHEKDLMDKDDTRQEVMKFPTPCYACD